FRMVSSDDDSGARSSSQSVLFCMLLLIVSGLPTYVGLTTAIYLPIAVALSGWFIVMALRFHGRRTAADARNLFLTSIIYLPLLLAALVITKR
ncbi:MAG: heme o synthase, partial [Limisphaerales bacterium]